MWSLAVADLGEGPRGPNPQPLFLDQPEAQRAEKNVFGDCPRAPFYVTIWMTEPPLSEGLDPPLTWQCAFMGSCGKNTN